MFRGKIQQACVGGRQAGRWQQAPNPQWQAGEEVPGPRHARRQEESGRRQEPAAGGAGRRRQARRAGGRHPVAHPTARNPVQNGTQRQSSRQAVGTQVRQAGNPPGRGSPR